MKSIYQKAFHNSMSYTQYRSLHDELIAENRCTGHDQSQLLVEFTRINHQRMKRLDKTLQLTDEMINTVNQLSEKQIWLVLSESWCGDAAQNVSVLAKIAAQNPLIDLRVVLRDDNDELMQQYLTNGGKSIPKLIAISVDFERELFTWGPRPAEAIQLVIDLKNKYGGITDEVKEALQKWYNEDKGISLQKEMIQLIKNAAV